MHTLLEQHKEKLQSLLLLFTCWWIFLGFLWALVLVITFELLEPIFTGKEENLDNHKESHSFAFLHQNIARKKTADFKSPKSFWQKTTKQKLCNRNPAADTYLTKLPKMFMTPKEKSTEKGEKKPSLMSLIHRKTVQKENYEKQPIVALVKNNISLSRRSSLSSPGLSQKRPLYEQYKSPLHSHVFLSSPKQSNFDSTNKSNLSMHGTYFVNRSILTSNLAKSVNIEETSNNTPFKGNFTRIESHQETRNVEEDTTSRDSIISVLKQKSKRKRSCAAQSPPASTKRTRFSDLTSIDSTLDDLFSMSPKIHSSLSRKRSASSSYSPKPKKTMVSIATQFSSPEDTKCIRPVKRRKKIGLSEEETNELMSDVNSTLEKPTKPQPTNEEKIESLSERSSVDDIPASEKSSLQDSTVDETDNNDETLCEENTSNGRLNTISFTSKFDLSLTNGLNRSLNSSLKNLKSPFKRTVPDTFNSLLRGKLRKHPVYFSAKIDVDEIQRNREEFGMKGASIRSYRFEQEVSAKRTEELFNGEPEEPKLTSNTTTVSPTTSSIDFSKTISSNAIASTIINQLAAPTVSQSQAKMIFPTLISSVASSSQNVPSTAATFSFGNASKTDAVSLPGFSVTNTTSATSTIASFNFGSSIAVSSTPLTSSNASTVSFNLPLNSSSQNVNTFGKSSFTAISSVKSLPSSSSTLFAISQPQNVVSSVSFLPPTTSTEKIAQPIANTSAFFHNTPTCAVGTSASIAGTSISTAGFSFGSIVPSATTTSSTSVSTSSGAVKSNFFASSTAAPSFLNNNSSTLLGSTVFGSQPPLISATSTQGFSVTATVPANVFSQNTNSVSQNKVGYSFNTTAPSFNFASGTPSSNISNPTFATTTANDAPSFNFGVQSAAPTTTTAHSFTGFGAPTNSVAPSIFSNVSSSQPANGPSPFGVNTFSAPVTSSNISFFGNTTSQAQPKPPPSVFASAPPTGGNIFGQQPTTSASVFNQAPTNSPFQFKPNPTTTQSNVGGFNFGSQNVNPFSVQAKSNTPSFFGTTTTAASSAPFGNTAFGFGSTNNSANPFNQPAPASKTSGFDFSSATKQAPSFLGATKPSFAAQPPKPSFNFNAQPAATPVFGAPSTPSFMQTPQHNSFGAPSTPSFSATPNFAATPNYGGGFAMGTSNLAPANREKARPRRRKR